MVADRLLREVTEIEQTVAQAHVLGHGHFVIGPIIEPAVEEGADAAPDWACATGAAERPMIVPITLAAAIESSSSTEFPLSSCA